MRPVNISFHNALLNSGCFCNASAITFDASTPRVLPCKFRYSKFLIVLMASTISFANYFLKKYIKKEHYFFQEVNLTRKVFFKNR